MIPERPALDPAVDRRNGLLFFAAQSLFYLGAPVFFVGVTQAALCNKLGASATIANLPATAFALGAVGPLATTCLIPHRWQQRVVILSAGLMVLLMLLTGGALVLPLGNGVRITAVVVESLAFGLLNSIYQLFLLQCLGRGTTTLGRARAMQWAYGFGPCAAVTGSLLAQFILRGGFPGLAFPKDFALLHFIALPCAAGMTWCAFQYRIEPLADEPRTPILLQVKDSFQRFASSRTLTVIWFAYLLWYCTFMAMSNLSLYTKEAMGRAPSEFSGLILAIRFGSKAVVGLAVGVFNIRFGYRAPLVTVVVMLGLGMLWANFVPGMFFLVAFGFMGGGELGAGYFPNGVLACTPASTSARDMAFLALVMAVAGVFPALYGFITDHWGFHASFVLGIAMALASIHLVFKLPARHPGER